MQDIFLATILERICLNAGSEKETYHLVLNLEGSAIDYHVGDCLGIYPQNDPLLVKRILQTLKASGQEIIADRHGKEHTLDKFLRVNANLLRLPNFEDETAASFCKKLAPQLPRFYSIASSKNVVGNEAHLTVAHIDGLCSHYLCKSAPLGEPVLSIFHHPSRNFSLPENSFEKPIIMIGPGTGIAPFRGFMQERMRRNTRAKSWLFFGERNRERDFYYQNFWQQLVDRGQLELECAFSRDQNHKIYVQHKILENSAKIWDWLQEGAYLFVCGNASKMAKDVDLALHQLIEKEGKFTPKEAKNFIRELKQANRYQRDVY